MKQEFKISGRNLKEEFTNAANATSKENISRNFSKSVNAILTDDNRTTNGAESNIFKTFQAEVQDPTSFGLDDGSVIEK